eukprot:CAMPEP_0172172262 /NCGR_PEP_ID=MMETSP1050-20130122/12344_1 /TAXON_ID=233186 /ORGANISM="Cryptomonas curvata, Strain CCAP979/52" /LENGTH=198 /DNA_ID=CAMNT_0012843773 /DNA_START=258 /DNA_END=854 /DNA_ORIENTATION=+
MGGGGGGFSIPMDESMINPLQGGDQSVGFEETMEMGPDGRMHVVSEKSLNGKPQAAQKLTPAQAKQQAALRKEMQEMAASIGQEFAQGDFGLRPARAQYPDDEADAGDAPDGAAAARHGAARKEAMSGKHPAKRVPNGWEVTGNSDIINRASLAIVGLAAVVVGGLLAYKCVRNKSAYRALPGSSGGTEDEALPFRGL